MRAPSVKQETFYSKAVKTKVSYHIYLPSEYDTDREKRYPTLYWLHGVGGSLKGMPALIERFSAAFRKGKLPPMLIVFPNGLPEGMWCDSKDGRTPVETIVVKELIPHIDAIYHTLARREGRIIEGFSMGGFGALRLAFKYPELFCAASSLGGGPLQRDFRDAPLRRGYPKREQVYQAVFGGDPNYFRAQSPWTLAEKNAAALRGKLSVRILVGERDPMLPANREFAEHLTRLNIQHAFTVLPGVRHNPIEIYDALGDKHWAFYHRRETSSQERTNNR